jgi:hypothetical protein
MSAIRWNDGAPPETMRDKRLLVIGHPKSGVFDAAEDQRPGIFIAHFLKQEVVPEWVMGMRQNNSRPALNVKHWAEINLPDGVELRSLKIF